MNVTKHIWHVHELIPNVLLAALLWSCLCRVDLGRVVRIVGCGIVRVKCLSFCVAAANLPIVVVTIV